MGCDIHLYSETKARSYSDKGREGGVWISNGRWYEDIEENYETKELIPFLSFDYNDSIYKGGRNYLLFSILAGVRSYRSEIEPISYPRYLPENVSKHIRNLSDRWDTGAHSHSYLTLREILEYDWEQKIEVKGVVPSEYEAVQLYGDSIIDIESQTRGVLVTRLAPIRESLEEFMETIETMKSWLKDETSSEDPSQYVTEDDIRIVFWFDN